MAFFAQLYAGLPTQCGIGSVLLYTALNITGCMRGPHPAGGLTILPSPIVGSIGEVADEAAYSYQSTWDSPTRKLRSSYAFSTEFKPLPALEKRAITFEKGLQHCTKVGYPASIRVDQGSEFISRELDLWAYMKGVTLDFSRPGKPTDNAFIESFNGKFRAECLNAHWFMSLDDAVRKCEAWRRDYNEVRPHSAIGDKPPISLLSASVAHGPP